jgi:ribosomal protein L40E
MLAPMSAGDQEDDVLTKFKMKYPLEFSLIVEMLDHFEDMCSEFYSQSDIYPRHIVFTVDSRSDAKRLTLKIKPHGMILLAAIAKTLVQNILSADPEKFAAMEQRAKKRMSELTTQTFVCQKCSEQNLYAADYCKKCGSKLIK